MRPILLLLLWLDVALGAKKKVSFAQVTEVLEYDAGGGGTVTSTSTTERRPSRSRKRSPSPMPTQRSNSGDFESESDSDDDFRKLLDKNPSKYSRDHPHLKLLAEKSLEDLAPRVSSSSSTQRHSTNSATSNRNSNSSGRSARNIPETLEVVRSKRGNLSPMAMTFFSFFDVFVMAFQDGMKNEFLSSEEIETYETRHGPVIKHKDPIDRALRVARPVVWLALNIWGFYDFPRGANWWGLALIANIVALFAWRHFDYDGMMGEISHWDYALGLAVFCGSGVVSLLHQIITLLTPFAIILAYALVLIHAAVNKPHHYY